MSNLICIDNLRCNYSCVQFEGFSIVKLDSFISEGMTICKDRGGEYYSLLISDIDFYHTVNNKKILVRKGESLLVMESSSQNFTKDETYRGYLILFDENFIIKQGSISTISYIFDRRKELTNGLALYKTPIQSKNIINYIYGVSISSTCYKESRVGNFFIINILRLLEGEVIDRYKINDTVQNRIFDEFREILIDNTFNSRDAKEYASKMNISYGILNRVCKNVVGSTPKQCIDYVLIAEAKKLLRITNKSIKEIAFDLGFDGASNFSKYFKKHVGELPLHFKGQVYLKE